MKQRYTEKNVPNNQKGPSEMTIKRILAFSKALDTSKHSVSKKKKGEGNDKK